MAWQEPLYKKEYCEIAIKVMSGGESLVAVAAEIGVARKTIYNWMDSHPEFNYAINVGKAKSQRLHERTGEDGINGEIKNFSAPAWIFTMKNRFREDYAEEKQQSSSEAVIEKIIDKLSD